MIKISERDKRAIKLGAIGIAAIIAFSLATKWLGHWTDVRQSLTAARSQLEGVDPADAKYQALLSVVPVVEMPQGQEKQKFLFRDKLSEQLKKAGVKAKPLKVLAVSKSKRIDGYQVLRLQCKGAKCKFDQMIDLLANLKENPYLVGIDEFRVRCDEKNRQEVEFDLTVSTFVR